MTPDVGDTVNGRDKRLREVEVAAAECRVHWEGQMQFNREVEGRVSSLERNVTRAIIWGTLLFAIAGFAGSLLGPALARRLIGG